jgi:hypothetical protein
MGSSGGDGGGYYPGMFGNATPQPGLPIAGQGAGVNPQEYGKFQSFLPNELIHESGPNDMATGLRPDMFKFKSPSGVVQESNTSEDIGALRDALAALTAKVNTPQQGNMLGGGGGFRPWSDPFAQPNGQRMEAGG